MAELISSALIPRTIVAMRDAGTAWRMVPNACSLEELPRHLADKKLAGVEKRLVGTGCTSPDRWDWVNNWALQRGWHTSCNAEHWYPLDEPLPVQFSQPTRADVMLSLTSIAWGRITIGVESNGTRLDTTFDDMQDELTILARFIQVLSAGGEPHAALTDYGRSHFIVKSDAEPSLCQVHISICGDSEHYQTLDVLVERQKLLQEFQKLANSIADHPNLAHHFICHCCLPENDYERALNRADLEWERGVAEGIFPDDVDKRCEFEACKLVAGVLLSAENKKRADQYRAMLRTLEIPRSFLVRYGLVSM